MQPEEFWHEVQRRRNAFFLVWVGWLVVGFPLWGFYSWIFGATDSMVAGVAALLTWGAFWKWTELRLTRMPCFRCGQAAFSHPYFFMRHAKCKNCGATPDSK